MIDYLFIVISASLSCAIVWIGVPLLRKIAYQRNLYDFPTGDRKIHKRFVSNLGGVALFASFLIGFSVSGFANEIHGYPYIVAALTILFFTGLKDDISLLSPTTKLITEVIAGLVVIFGAGVQINHFHGFLGVDELSVIVSVPLTLFTMIVVMNAYNLIDGIDGLAGGIGMIAALLFGVGFLVAGLWQWAVLALFVLLPLLVFLAYNTEPAKIFMGDSGSLTIGFLLSLLAIQFTGLSSIQSFANVFGDTSPILAAVFLVLPLFDTIRVYVRRVARRKSPFEPDKDHIHHLLLNLGFSHKRSSFLLYLMSVLVIGITLLFSLFLNVHVVFVLFFASIFVFMPTFGAKRNLLSSLGFNTEHWLPFLTGALTSTANASLNKSSSSEKTHETESTNPY